MPWRISSCFDCKLFQERNAGFYCPAYHVALSYDVARTVNDCPHKVPYDEKKSNRDKLLDRLYSQCCEYAENVQGPFTAKEFVLLTDYQNKNSLWPLLEELVKQGRLQKGKMRIANRYGHIYRSNVYFPVWRKEVQPAILQLATQVLGEECTILTPTR